MLLSVASIAFSFARPLDQLSATLPLSSIFHPALLLSVLGQLAIHATCMLYSLQMAKEHMSETEINQVHATTASASSTSLTCSPYPILSSAQLLLIPPLLSI